MTVHGFDHISAGAMRTLKVSGIMETAGWSSISIVKYGKLKTLKAELCVERM